MSKPSNEGKLEYWATRCREVERKLAEVREWAVHRVRRDAPGHRCGQLLLAILNGDEPAPDDHMPKISEAAKMPVFHAGAGPARSDTERLDWLLRTLSSLHCNWTSPNDWTVTLYGPDAAQIGVRHGNTPREAIDAAIDAEEDEW